ncbi:MAG: bifunctional methylenetetrahydrofolate dehydrogenase/methenyltetrahydrofolate cyclohydrolase [Luteitalea sp.]|nr:bifunctional methylenetetrahydrofolate dehydrogenase/methenyltetrahydrofolate cyclohydrolase [Luteitalea sp.]
MTARILDGARVAREIRAELTPQVAAFAARGGRPPGLGIVLIGEDPASQIYVRSKARAGGEVGFWIDLHVLPASTSLADVLALVTTLNRSDRHDGILVQSPLPQAMGEGATRQVFDTIDPAKDVDGFSAESVGRLVQNRPGLRSCTPAGIMELLDRCGIDPAGRHAVIIGRSDIVGKPMALMLLHRHATVTICHSRTPDLADTCARADLLVAAIGRAGFVTRGFVKPGATVVDVGMNRLSDETEVRRFFGDGSPRIDERARKGSVLIGDVHPEVAEVAGALTPVPGGVGPLTVAMLMKNTLAAAEARAGRGT